MPALDADMVIWVLGVLGLLVGSFLNVVIHRLPVMMDRRWAAECASLRGEESDQQAVYNLMHPRSACPQCRHTIRWYENIPVLSYLWLRGRCSSCATPIGKRYPAIELVTAVVFATIAWRHGPTMHTWVLCGYAAAIIALAAIDWDTTLLPDDITLPLVWAGLVVAAMGWSPVAWPDAFWGAVVGYLSLWSIYWAFKLLTGKEGMGYGDFKLLAAIGAWLGWSALLPVILVASLCGTAVGLLLKWRSELREGGYVPFGPFLALGALAVPMYPPLGLWLLP